ncbi:hypothetical protein [Streptomyces sp. NPDC003952]
MTARAYSAVWTVGSADGRPGQGAALGDQTFTDVAGIEIGCGQRRPPACRPAQIRVR